LKGAYFHGENQDRGIGLGDAENVLKGLNGPALVAAPALVATLWKMFNKSGSGTVSWKQFLLIALELKFLLKSFDKSQSGKINQMPGQQYGTSSGQHGKHGLSDYVNKFFNKMR